MKEKFLNFLGSIFDFVFDKYFWVTMGVIGFAFFALLNYQVEEIQSEKDKMYCIRYERTKYWAKEVSYNQDGSLSFVDVENNRPYKIFGGNYVIAEPKVK